jgi:VIT1/CCC1 family predicted Fe2+/Mn2+ transporter
MTDEAAIKDPQSEGFGRASIAVRLDEERRRASLLGDLREAIFGARDGLVSTLAVVSNVSGATNDRFPVLIARIATALGGIFSMAADEYLSSKSQREIALAQIAEERERVADRRGDMEAELAYMLEEDGLSSDEAGTMAAVMARHPEAILDAKVEKEFGIAIEEAQGSPLQGGRRHRVAFGLGALAPILHYSLLPVGVAFFASVLATGAVLFAIGVAKTGWTHGAPVASGVEIPLIGAFAGIAGYFFGNQTGNRRRKRLLEAGVTEPGGQIDAP